MLGISPDPPERQSAFCGALNLPFRMLPDPQKRVIRLYGARRALGLGVRRITYVIDREKVIRAAMHHEVRIGRHVDQVRRALAELQGSQESAVDNSG